jgi:hypothetical protein
MLLLQHNKVVRVSLLRLLRIGSIVWMVRGPEFPELYEEHCRDTRTDETGGRNPPR